MHHCPGQGLLKGLEAGGMAGRTLTSQHVPGGSSLALKFRAGGQQAGVTGHPESCGKGRQAVPLDWTTFFTSYKGRGVTTGSCLRPAQTAPPLSST